jgi:hypothetical protein
MTEKRSTLLLFAHLGELFTLAASASGNCLTAGLHAGICIASSGVNELRRSGRAGDEVADDDDDDDIRWGWNIES